MIIIIVEGLNKQKKGILKTYMVEVHKNTFIANNISGQIEELWKMCKKFAKGGILVSPSQIRPQKISCMSFGSLANNIEENFGIYISKIKT